MEESISKMQEEIKEIKSDLRLRKTENAQFAYQLKTTNRMVPSFTERIETLNARTTVLSQDVQRALGYYTAMKEDLTQLKQIVEGIMERRVTDIDDILAEERRAPSRSRSRSRRRSRSSSSDAPQIRAVGGGKSSRKRKSMKKRKYSRRRC